MPLGAAGANRDMSETSLEPIATWACCRQRDWICPARGENPCSSSFCPPPPSTSESERNGERSGAPRSAFGAGRSPKRKSAATAGRGCSPIPFEEFWTKCQQELQYGEGPLQGEGIGKTAVTQPGKGPAEEQENGETAVAQSGKGPAQLPTSAPLLSAFRCSPRDLAPQAENAPLPTRSYGRAVE